MNSFSDIRILVLTIIVLISLFGCFQPWLKECDEPYLTLDDLIANKNFLMAKYEKIALSRAKRWSRESEYFYEFRDYEKCRTYIKYFGRKWKYWDGQKTDCEMIINSIFECRRICDSLQIVDLRIYKLETKTDYDFGYNLNCVEIPNFFKVSDSLNRFRFIYLINMEKDKPPFDGINSYVQSFVYKNHKFCLSEY